jgi:hypothetical protein
MCDEAQGYLDVVVPIINDGIQSPAFTINMDQTPVLHAMNPKDTMEGDMHNQLVHGRQQQQQQVSDHCCHDHSNRLGSEIRSGFHGIPQLFQFQTFSTPEFSSVFHFSDCKICSCQFGICSPQFGILSCHQLFQLHA